MTHITKIVFRTWSCQKTLKSEHLILSADIKGTVMQIEKELIFFLTGI